MGNRKRPDRMSAVYEILTSEDDGRVCRDIPESACKVQPRNFFVHVFSLAATKTGDGLSDPKLVLSWILTQLGAPAFLIGLLVPVREAGALLPQLFTAGAIRSMPQRKWAWAGGSLSQGMAVAGIGVCSFVLEGASAGWAVIALLAVFSVARSVCSVSYKDVLGKTVSKATRGTATGAAGTVSAILVLVYGVLLAVDVLPKSITVIAGALFVAGGLWAFSAVLFCTLAEEPGATEGGGNPVRVALDQISLLRDDPQLVRFIAVRGLLMATALAPPFLVSLSGQSGGRALGELGTFVIASALASVGSSYLWGRLSDKSSRRVLALSGVLGGIVFVMTAALAAFGTDLLSQEYTLPVAMFGLMFAYQGVRLGRATHIVDMASADKRAAYTAISNTVVGVLLVAGGIFGVIAELAGTVFVLTIFAGMCGIAAMLALGLEEVQESDRETT